MSTTWDAPLVARRPVPIAPTLPAALRFTAAMLFACLILQRFGLPFGGKSVNIVGPVGLALAGLYMVRGALAFDRFRLGCFVALAACAVFGLSWHAIVPGRFGEAPNFQSLSQFLLLTGFATLTFEHALNERDFFRLVNRWFGYVAIAGAIQFFVQLVGLRVFAFTGLLPDAILFEYGYNQQIPVGTADLLKSNGFFLIEPSVFSQVMALGLIIEILAFRRWKYLSLFVTGLLLSFSGTGWIVLISFVVAAAVGMGKRGLAIAGLTVVLLGSVLAVGSLAVPDIASALQERVDEISRPMTSGHRRFITPFWLLDDTLKETPSVAVVGLGSGVSERLDPAYAYDVNTPIKIFLEYGLPGLIAYVLLFIGGRKSPIQRAILVPAMAMFFVAGAYQQFAPVLFLVLMLVSVARLEERLDDRPAPAAS